MLTGFEKRIAGFIETKELWDPGERVLLAVSGGADSMTLLYAMCQLRDEGVLANDFVCAHINHQLRGAEADKDEEFVVTRAQRLGVAVKTVRLNVKDYARENKLSIETAGRKLRIGSLQEFARACDCAAIATGHHKNDNAETIVQRLARGTGFRGLGGIWPMRSFEGGACFVRPLLCVRRDEIVAYLNRRGLKWRTDLTNEDLKYRRNYIRHQLIPALEAKHTGSMVEQMAKLADSARGFYGLVCDSADEIWAGADCGDEETKLDLEKFSMQHPAVKIELVRRSLARLGSGEGNLTQEHYERIMQLVKQEMGGKKIELPGGFVARREYGDLIFERAGKISRADEQDSESVELKVPGRTEFGGYVVEAAVLEAGQSDVGKFKAGKDEFVEWFDLEKVSLPLTIRFRRTGDRFWPLGLAGEKRVGKFLTAAKVPQELREKLVVVGDREKIIWVWPVRMSERARVDKETGKILELKINEA